MKNWRTTVAGLIVGLPVAMQAILEAYTAGYFTDKTGLQLFAALGLIVLARLSKDHNVTGSSNPVADLPPEEPIEGGGVKNPK